MKCGFCNGAFLPHITAVGNLAGKSGCPCWTSVLCLLQTLPAPVDALDPFLHTTFCMLCILLHMTLGGLTYQLVFCWYLAAPILSNPSKKQTALNRACQQHQAVSQSTSYCELETLVLCRQLCLLRRYQELLRWMRSCLSCGSTVLA